MSSPSPLPSRPSLSSLPPELITAIVAHLPQYDAISLALSARAFFAPTERRIGEELMLVLPSHFGEFPLVQPFGRKEKGYKRWAKAEEGAVEARQRDGLRDLVKRVAMFAGERRLGMVQGMRIDPRPGSLYGLIHLLDAVSPALQRLKLERYRRDRFDWDDDVRLEFHDTIEHKFIDAGIFFPALTHVQLGDYTIQYSDFILQLCRSAPNLVDLDTGYQSYLPTDDLEPYFPLDVRGPTKLERLQVAFESPEPRDDNELIDDPTAIPILIILDSSPTLRQLCIDYSGNSYSIVCPIGRILSGHQNLTDLYWPIYHSYFLDLSFDDKPISGVRRLAFRPLRWSEIFCPPEGFPNLEVLCLVRSRYSQYPITVEPTASPQSSSVYPMIPSFSDGLRHSPKLSIIHTLPAMPDDRDLDVFVLLDEVEAKGTAIGFVRSYIHGSKELLHAGLLLYHIEVSDEVTDRVSGRCAYDLPEMSYEARDGQRHKKTFVQLPEPTWLHFTDIDDLVVPLAVIEKMRVVQGATEAEWRKRGVEVGDPAWAVLMDWREEQEEAKRQGEMEKTKLKREPKRKAKKAH